jgi:hypothetical protein
LPPPLHPPTPSHPPPPPPPPPTPCTHPPVIPLAASQGNHSSWPNMGSSFCFFARAIVALKDNPERISVISNTGTRLLVSLTHSCTGEGGGRLGAAASLREEVGGCRGTCTAHCEGWGWAWQRHSQGRQHPLRPHIQWPGRSCAWPSAAACGRVCVRVIGGGAGGHCAACLMRLTADTAKMRAASAMQAAPESQSNASRRRASGGGGEPPAHDTGRGAEEACRARFGKQG